MKSLKVLLAEDDIMISMGLKARLEKLGFHVVAEASNGIEAIILTDKFNPDVILMDIKMPKKNGLEAAREIREKHNTPIVFLTAYDEIGLIKTASSLNALGYLIKPVSDRTLASTILMSVYKTEKLVNHNFTSQSHTAATTEDDQFSIKQRQLYIVTLGGFEVYQDGFLLNMDSFVKGKSGSRKTKALLAYLVSNKKVWVSKEELFDLFWPMTDWELANTSFNRSMYSLRRALQPSLGKREESRYIFTQNSLYTISQHDIKVDMDIFSLYVQLGIDEINQGLESEAVNNLKKAAALYKGDWMKGVLNAEDWCLGTRQQLKNDYIKVKKTLAGLAHKKQQYEEELQHYQEALRQDYYDEVLNLKIIEVLKRMRKYESAAQHQRAYQNRLKSLDD